MAKYSNTVEYQIRTTLDSSGIAKLKAELTSLQNLTKTKGAQGIWSQSQVNKTLADINKVKTALTQAFNPKLGMVSNKALFSSIGKDLNSIYGSFSKLGPQGVRAFAQVYGQVGKIDMGMKRISSTSDKIMNTFGNTFRWGMIASVFSGIMNSIHQSVQYVKDLDKSLTNIQMVTAQSRESMNEFAVQANEAAKRLGGTTVQMTNATEVFVRQGHNLETSTELGQYAVHLANVSGQDSATASDEITAYMNAFHIPLEDLGNAISKWAVVANNAAVSVEELSVASQKAASVATTVGVDMDQFAGHIAAIEATTREAPENIGNGLKTIYSRIADVKLGEKLEDGVDLGSFAKAIEKVGVSVLDQAGKLRDAGDIIEDLMVVWKDLDQSQQAAVAKTVAGRFQLARFEALMNSADIYEKSVGVSREEEGTETYDRMQETYAESMQGRLNTLHATIEGIFTKAFNTDDFYGLVDAATALAETFDNLVQAMGGGQQAILAFSAIMTKTFANNIGRGISNMVTNMQTKKMGTENQQFAAQQAKMQLAGQGLNTNNLKVNNLVNNRAMVTQYAPQLNNEQIEKANALWEKQIATFKQLNLAEEEYNNTVQATKTVLSALGFSAQEVNGNLIALLKSIESGGAEAKITGETLSSIQLDKFIDKLKNTQLEITEFTVRLRRAQETGLGWDKVIEMADKLGISLREIGIAANLSEDQMKSLEVILRQLDEVTAGETVNVEKLGTSLQEASINVNQLISGLEKLVAEGGINSETLERQQQKTVSLAEAQRQLAAEGRAMAGVFNTQALASGFATMASSLMTGVFAMQSFINVFKILNDEDLTIGEKVEQLTMNIVMVAAMGIPALTQTKTAIAEIKTALEAWRGEQAAMMVTEQLFADQQALNIALRGQTVKSIVQELAVQGQLNREQLVARLLEEGYSEAQAKGIATRVLKLNLDKEILGVTKLEVVANKLLNTSYGQGIAAIAAYVLAKLGVTTAEEGATVAKEKGAVASLVLAAAEKVAAGGAGLLVASILPLAAATAIIVGAVLWIKHLSEEEEKRKERLQEEIDANQTAVDSIHEHRDALAKLHAEYKNSGEASDEYKDALKEQAEALGIVNAELLIATGQYERLKNEIDQATASTLGYNDALLRQKQEDSAPEIRGGLFTMSEDAKKAAGVFSNEDPVISANKINTAYEKQKKTISELSLALKGLEAQNKDHKNDDRIQALSDEKDKLEDLQDEYMEFLSKDGTKDTLSNQEQLIQNEVLEGRINGPLTEVMNYDDLYAKLTDADLFPQLHKYLEGRSEEDGLAYVHGLMSQIAESLDDKSLMNEIGLKDAESNAIQGLSETFDVDSDTTRAMFENMLSNVEGFDQLSDKNKMKIIAGLDTEKSLAELQKDIEQTISDLKNGKSVEGISSAADIITMKPVDEDVDEKEFQNLGEYIGNNAKDLKGFADSLSTDTDELADVTEAILRFDHALEVSGEKIKEWEEALSSDSLEEKAQAAAELSNVYEDMLDIGEDISLSDDFVSDVHNLELLQKAAKGSEKAYEELQDAAAKDILIHAGLDDSQVKDAMGDINSIQDNIKDIKIGAEIKDENGLYAKLENIINKAGFTAKEASAFLSDIGINIDPTGFEEVANQLPSAASTTAEQVADAMSIDTEIESGTAEEQTVDTYSNVTAKLTTVPIEATLPAGLPDGSPQPLTGSVQNVQYKVDTQPVPKVQNLAGFGVKAKTKNGKGSGGKLTIKKGALKKAPGGAVKYNNSSNAARNSGSCFIAGTLVTTKDSYKNIEDIVPGDIVLSYNEKLRINEYSIVLQTMIHKVNEKLYTLYIENEQLTATGIHRFFVKRNNQIQWIEASSLQINDLMLFADYTWHKIKNIKVKVISTTVYNFEVSNNHNYYVGLNQILAHNKGGNGGKGSGGNKKKNEKKEYKAKKRKDPIDYYEKVNTTLDKLESNLKDLATEEDRLIGTKLMKNLEKQSQIKAEQVDAYKDKLKIANKEAKKLRDTLSEKFGAEFDENGQLMNYRQIEKNLKDEYDELYKKWNGRKLTDKEKEKADKEFEAYDKKKSDFEEKYKRYDELYSTVIPGLKTSVKELGQDIEDFAKNLRDLRREGVQSLYDIQSSMIDINKTYDNLFGERPVKNLEHAKEAIDNILGGGTTQEAKNATVQRYQNMLSDKNVTAGQKEWAKQQIEVLGRTPGDAGLLDYNRQLIQELAAMETQWNNTGSYMLNGKKMFDGEYLHEALKQAVEDGKQLMSDLKSSIDDYKASLEAVIEMVDDTIEKTLDKLDGIGDKIEHLQSMNELLYGDKANAQQVQLYQRQAENEENRLKILEEQKEFQEKITEQRKIAWELDKTNADAQKAYYEALQKEQDIDGQILDTREAIVQAYKDAKEVANDLAVDNWLNNFNGQINGVNIPLEYMADQWERIKENEELYLDDLNRAYEIQKLSNKYQQLLNDTVDPTIQQQITDQMKEQLGYLNEKTNLSKYDVEYANAQLEILQKTIALEDARAAKNQMKLRRDSQGNYQYVYAADQNKTADAENDLLDASMNAYNMSKEEQANVQDSYIKKVQDMADALRQAANDATLNEEQIAAITQDIMQMGWEYLDAMGEQLSTSQKNMIMSFIDAAENLQGEYSQNVQNIANELKENTERGLDDVDDRFDTSVQRWVENEEEIRAASDETRDEIVSNVKDFTKSVSKANIDVKVPLNNLQAGFKEIDDEIVSMNKDMGSLFSMLKTESNTIINTSNAINTLQKSLFDANNELSQYVQELDNAKKKIADQERVIAELKAQLANPDLDPNKPSSGSGKGSSGNGGSGKGKSGNSGSGNKSGDTPSKNSVAIGKEYIYTGGLYYEDSEGHGNKGDRGPGKKVKVYNLNWGAPYPISVTSDDSAVGWLKLSQLKNLKTGGYTGSWNGADTEENGRLAFLHQKELILNAEDTKNILAAVEAVRAITDQLRSSAIAGSISGAIGRAAQNNIQGNNVEQRVEITANFPNVSSADEIEKALLNISDRSYQYAYNKNDIPW